LLIFAVRLAAVALGTAGTGLGREERIFLDCIAPCGVVAVAVAVSSILAMQLQLASAIQAEHLEPATFLIIIGAVQSTAYQRRC
jgi:NhaP-type Na+/H+ or K+/H+ antiporter